MDDAIEVQGQEEEAGLSYTERKIQERIIENPDNTTTDSGDESDVCFDDDSDTDFDDEIDGDEEEGDCYMD